MKDIADAPGLPGRYQYRPRPKSVPGSLADVFIIHFPISSQDDLRDFFESPIAIPGSSKHERNEQEFFHESEHKASAPLVQCGENDWILKRFQATLPKTGTSFNANGSNTTISQTR